MEGEHEVIVHDDKKEKRESVTAKLFVDASDNSFDLYGYGATEQEARANLRDNVEKMIRTLTAALPTI